MRIEKRRWDDVILLTFIGEVDVYSHERFTARIDTLVERGYTQFAFNLRLLTFINSAALGYLIRTRNLLEGKGGDLVIVQPSKFVRKTLVILGLDEVFRLLDTDADAIRYFREDIGDDVGVNPGRLPVEVGDAMIGAGALIFRVLNGPGSELPPPGTILDVGRISRLHDGNTVFRWRVSAPGRSDASSGIMAENFGRMIRPGVSLEIRFREPLDYRSPFTRLEGRVSGVEMVEGEGGVREAEITVEHKILAPQESRSSP